MSTTTYSYDDLGRVKGSSQQPWGGTTRSFTYGSNWVDGVTSIGYPSGRSVSYTYDGAGRVTTVTGTKGGVSTAYYQPPAISPELQYAPHGGLRDRRASTFGTETIHYNDRLQTSTITVNGGATQLLGLTYGYGEVSSQNNGNVMSQVIQPLGATQNYEGENRLGTFTETRSGQSFAQGFGYDVWGNRWMSSMTGGVPNGVPNGPAWFNTTTNRLNLLQHDNNGNLRALSPYTGRYSAENLLAELESTGNGSARFEYDGDGRRVRKITCGTPSNCTAGTSGAVVTEYVYDAMGNLAAEYGPINDPGTRYVFTDALGSTRLTTDAAGNSVRRYDYAPFGEELTPAWTNWRTTAAGYGAVDSFPPKFTGKERDAETGLDYFEARYLSSAQGRFTSPDTPGYASLRNPQAWNLYAYALNNPLKFVDPDGHEVVCAANADDCKMAIAAATGNADAAARVGTKTTTTKHSFLGIHWTTSKTTITISGDLGSFRALGQNASRLADLVSDRREFGFNASSSTYKGTPTTFGSWLTAPGERPLYGGGQSLTPTQKYEPASFIDPNPATYAIDTDAQASGIPPANMGEKAAHEFLGHLWGEMRAGHPAGGAQNKQDSLDAENAVRRLDPQRGQKTQHH